MQTTNSSVEDDMFQVRKLEITDNNKGFSELLQQLTVCDSVSDEAFEERFHELAKCGDEHIICVIEDYNSGKIVATGSVFIEKKFIRNCGKVGHIEDVVVDSVVRGKQLGKRIVDFLSDHARVMGCYKGLIPLAYCTFLGPSQNHHTRLSNSLLNSLLAELFVFAVGMNLTALSILEIRNPSIVLKLCAPSQIDESWQLPDLLFRHSVFQGFPVLSLERLANIYLEPLSGAVNGVAPMHVELKLL